MMIFQSLFALLPIFISVAQGSVFRNFPEKLHMPCGSFIQFIIDVLNVDYRRQTVVIYIRNSLTLFIAMARYDTQDRYRSKCLGQT